MVEYRLVILFIAALLLVGVAAAESVPYRDYILFRNGTNVVRDSDGTLSVSAQCHKIYWDRWQTKPIHLTFNPNYPGLDSTMLGVNWQIVLLNWLEPTAIGNDDSWVEWGVDGVKPGYNEYYNYDPALPGYATLFFSDAMPKRIVSMTRVFDDPADNTKIIQTHTMLNGRLPWYTGPSRRSPANKFHLGRIIIHDTGHILGLGDLRQSTCSRCRMYQYVRKGQGTSRYGCNGDLLGITDIYGRAAG